LHLENFERYRKYYHCPIKGCKSKSVKKPSNHLASVHKITDTDERKKLLKDAKKLGVAQPAERRREQPRMTIMESFKRSSEKNKNIVYPTAASKKGSTRAFPHYKVKETDLVQFFDNLTSFDGGNRSSTEAMQIAMDVSKFLAFADNKQLSWKNLFDIDRMKSYFEYLKKCGIGPDGILTKIERMQTCIKYLVRANDTYKTRRADANDVLDRISLWKTSFRNEKILTTKES